VWRLDLATLRWEGMPALVTARSHPACCAVRGKLVVLGGRTPDEEEEEEEEEGGGPTSSVEMLSSEEGAFFVDLPPLSCGGIYGAAAIAVEESDSAAGQVLLLGGMVQGNAPVSTVHLVDLATGVCTPGRPVRKSLCCRWRRRYTCSARAIVLRPLGCQVGASCAWEDSAVAFSRRRCGGRRCKERRTQHEFGDNCPR
jgi:hypothetical protein